MSSFKNILFCFFIVYISLTSVLFPQQKEKNNDIFSPLNRKIFGDYLYSQKDYLRAFDEYKSYLKSYSNDTVIFKIGSSFIEMERLNEAEDYFKTLFLQSKLKEEAELQYYFVKFKQNEPLQFRELCDSRVFYPEKYSKSINRLKQITYFFDRKYVPDTLELFYYFNFDSLVLKKVHKLYFEKYYPKYKSPLTAGLLSSIIPGLGKIYTKNYSDGVTAFLVSGVLGYLAYDNFRAKHNTRAWIFAGLGGLFYAGNIYGAAASANIYNAQIKINLDGEINTFFKSNNYFLPKFINL
ncbi:MAG: hypothetical protein V1773_10170 [bacterium]